VGIGTHLPESLKRLWWYCTDAQWRDAYRTMQQRLYRRQTLQRRAYLQIWEQTGGRIATGPFQGLSYLKPTATRAYPQKLLGTYEKELWGIVEEIIARDYSLIIDIGAGEGFYVCGLASRLPQAKILAYEAQRNCHARIFELAELNGVSARVSLRGLCQSTDLGAALAEPSRTLIICDVEGAECDLLDPTIAPNLARVDLLVEVHEHFRPGVAGALKSRFGASHQIAVVAANERTIADLPPGIELDATMALAAMDEGRGTRMEWFWMRCKR